MVGNRRTDDRVIEIGRCQSRVSEICTICELGTAAREAIKTPNIMACYTFADEVVAHAPDCKQVNDKVQSRVVDNIGNDRDIVVTEDLDIWK